MSNGRMDVGKLLSDPIDLKHPLPNPLTPDNRGDAFIRKCLVESPPEIVSKPRNLKHIAADHFECGPSRQNCPPHICPTVPIVLRLPCQRSPMQSIGPQVVLCG